MNGFATSSFLVALPATLAMAAALQAGTLALAVRGGRHSAVDVTWGAGFVAIAAVACALGWDHGVNGRRLLIFVLTAAWGLRLAGHIYLRLRKHPGEDRRYEELLARGGTARTRYAITHVYLPQGLTQWFISLPVQVAMFQQGGPGGLSGIGVLGGVGIALWTVGFVFEAVGDHQLAVFQRDPSSSGRVLDSGLWRYTRHPNYFGDACVWWGLSLIAFAHWPGILTIASPVLMTYLLTRGTGAEMLERTIGDRRPGYAEYVRRTSGFFPAPPKRTT
jgi:steroid 5-alpha reductase family enzyme